MAHLIVVDGPNRMQVEVKADDRFVADLLAWIEGRSATPPKPGRRICAGPGCTTAFEAAKPNQLYCSKPCKRRANKRVDAGRHRAEPPRRNVPPPPAVPRGIPKVTRVLGAMQFPCPHEDCERHTRPYDDENRLTHHLRVIHDFEFVEPVHEVQAHVPAMAVKVG